jgi:hypothetical protein
VHSAASPFVGILRTFSGFLFLVGVTGPLTAQEIAGPAADFSPDAAVGRLTQVIDAVPLRGEEIRLRVALRVEEAEIPPCGPREAEPGEIVSASDHCDPGAFGWLRLDAQPAAGPGVELRTVRVASSQWSVEEVRTRVPEDALDLLFGVLLEGDGPMWADDVQLAVRRPDGVWRRLAIPNDDFESVASGGRPAAWGGIDPAWEARIDRDQPYEGSGAIRIARTRPVPGTD